jgi:hypothetical protein
VVEAFRIGITPIGENMISRRDLEAHPALSGSGPLGRSQLGDTAFAGALTDMAFPVSHSRMVEKSPLTIIPRIPAIRAGRSAIRSGASLLVLLGPIAAQTTGRWREPLPDPMDLSWTKPANWVDQDNPTMPLTQYPGGPGGPGNAIIDRGTANLTEPLTLQGFSLGSQAAEGATLTGSASLTVNGAFNVPTTGTVALTGATLLATGTTTIGGDLRLANGARVETGGVLLGTANSAGSISFTGATGSLEVDGTLVVSQASRVGYVGSAPSGASLSLLGSLVKGSDDTQTADFLAKMTHTGGGVIEAQRGTLRFANPAAGNPGATLRKSFQGSRFTTSGEGSITLDGLTELSGTSFTTGGTGEIMIIGGDHQVTDTLTSAGTKPVQASGGRIVGQFGASRLNFSQAAPLLIDGATIEDVLVSGYCSLRGGSMTGLCTLNSAVADGIVVPSGATFMADNGQMSNLELLTFKGGTITTLNGGYLFNQGTGTLRMESGAISPFGPQREQGAVLNFGLLKKSTPGVAEVLAPYVGDADSRIEVEGGTLRFDGTHTLRGDAAVSGAGSILQLGGNSATRARLQALDFRMTAGGETRLLAGEHTLVGNVIVRSGQLKHLGGTVAAEAGGSPFIGTADGGAGWVLGDSSSPAVPMIRIADTLEFGGDMKVRKGEIGGPGTFRSGATSVIDFEGNLAISNDGMGADWTQEGLVRCPTANTALTLGPGVSVSNTGTFDDSANFTIGLKPGAADVEFINEGALRKIAGGGALTVSVPYIQGSGGSIVAQSGSVRFDGANTILGGGAVEAANGAKVEFLGPSEMATATASFSDGGAIEFGGSARHRVIAFGGSGAGEARVVSGEYGPPDGSSALLGFTDGATFVVAGGKVVGGPLENVGAFALRGGSLESSSFTNATGGSVTQTGGTVSAAVTNRGAYDFNQGTLAGSLTNLAAEAAPFDVTGSGLLVKRLATGADFFNGGFMRIAPDVLAFRLQSGSLLNNLGTGTIRFLGSGQITGEGGSGRFINNGRLEFFGGTSTIAVPFESRVGSTLVASAGAKVSLNAVTELGGCTVAPTGASTEVTVRGGLVRDVAHQLSGGTRVSYRRATDAALEIQGALSATGSGFVFFSDLPTTVGATSFTGDSGAVFSFSNGCDLRHAVSNAARMNWLGGTYGNAGGGVSTFTNAADTAAKGSLTVSFGSTMAGLFLRNEGEVLLRSSLTLGNFGTLNNNGLVSLESGGNVLDGGSGTRSFTNAGFGTLRKQGTGFNRVAVPFEMFGGIVDLQAGSTEFGSFLQLGGETIVSPGASISGSQFTILGGTFRCAGTKTGPLTHRGGTVKIGSSPGTFVHNGAYTMEGDALLEIEIGGPTPGTGHDLMQVSGPLTLGGKLRLHVIDGFVPTDGQTFVVATASGGISGDFAQIIPPTDLPPGVTLGAARVGNQIVVTAVVAETYGDFATASFTEAERADPLVSGPDADPNGNRIPNLWEWILARDPKAANDGSGTYELTAAEEVIDGERFIVLRIPWKKGISGVALEVHGTPTLGAGTWQLVPYETRDAEDQGDRYLLALRVPKPAATQRTGFFRINASLANE